MNISIKLWCEKNWIIEYENVLISRCFPLYTRSKVLTELRWSPDFLRCGNCQPSLTCIMLNWERQVIFIYLFLIVLSLSVCYFWGHCGHFIYIWCFYSLRMKFMDNILTAHVIFINPWNVFTTTKRNKGKVICKENLFLYISV